MAVRNGRARAWWVWVVAVGVLASAPVGAQSDEERAGARAAATEGAQAFKEKRWQEAIELFERAESLLHAPPHLLFMARAHTELGHLVKARELYRKIISENLPPSAPRAFLDAQDTARAELAPLEPRIPTLKVTVAGGGKQPGLVVTVDGVAIPTALVGVARPVDPGEHRVRAYADGLASDEVAVTLTEGKPDRVELTLKPSADRPPGAAAAGGGAGAGTPGSAGSGTPGAPAEAPPPGAQQGGLDGGGEAGGGGLRTVSYVSLGLGVVGLGLGTVFALDSASKRSEADDLCGGDGTSCPIEEKARIDALDDEAGSAQTLATVGFVVGGVGLAAGAVMFLLSAPDEGAAPATGVRVRPWVGAREVGVTGTF